MLRINNLKIRENISDEALINLVIHKFNIKSSDIVKWHIYKKSIDARKKTDIFFNYIIDIEVKDESKYSHIHKIEKVDIEKMIKNNINFSIVSSLQSEAPPVIVGAGPAGLFSALILVQNGICPIIIE